MAFRDLAFRASERARGVVGASKRSIRLTAFEVEPEEAAQRFNGSAGRIGELFFAHHGRELHKWIHYLEVYERHFHPYQNTPVKMLEIGVSKGGSLELWREYFGPPATIFGIDITPECANRVTPPNQVRIGSQDDARFLQSVISEMGTPDIILDDGSHIGRHQHASFRTLFPLLKEGGLYLIEDLCTSYAPGHMEGGYRRKGTGIELVKDMIDDMHAWYHHKGTTTPARDLISGIHVYNSLVVIEKRNNGRPVAVYVQRDPPETPQS